MKSSTWDIQGSKTSRQSQPKSTGKSKPSGFLSSIPQSLALMICIGVVQIAGYYFAGAMAKIDGPGIAVPQPDTLLYCQAARRIVEGHPFSYSAGEAMTTGTTSVAYPFVLAVPYALGAKGDALLTAGFVLNALFYLLFLAGWGVAIRHWLSRPASQMAASLLVALSGQAAFCALAQSDIGMWLAASAWLAAGLATGNASLYGTMLLIGPWIRPEGMVCVIAFAAIAALKAIMTRKLDKAVAIVAISGLVSMVGVFALNMALTGEAQFSSVAQKGYLKQYDFAEAIQRTVIDAMKMAKALLLGIPVDIPRDLYAIPVLGALFMWRGIIERNWKIERDAGLLVWCLASLGGFATVANSGWQGTNLDRYIAWFIPAILVFTADGAIFYGRQFRNKDLRHAPAAIACLFAAGASFAFFCIFHQCSRVSDRMLVFARECDGIMRGTASIGGHGGCGIAYGLSDRRVAHIAGIYSKEFLDADPLCKLEILKNSPDTRFEYWFNLPGDFSGISGMEDDILGPQVAVGPDGMQLRFAKWDAFDKAASPSFAMTNMTLAARVDVGYRPDEKAVDYIVHDRYRRPQDFLFCKAGKLDKNNIVECGRLVAGTDEMTLPLEPGKDVKVIMRLLKEHEFSADGKKNKYALKSPLFLCIEAEGEEACDVSVSLGENDFTDVLFTIPGKAIRQTPCRLSFNGERIVCCYWFYQ